MSETFQAYFNNLETMPTNELDRVALELVGVENRNVALVIAHLAEIARRKAELEHGYKSLFDYGVRRLGLSEGSVALRIQVANVARRFPQVLDALAAGTIALSVAGRLAPHLREENVETLLRDCAGMTKRAVEEYVVRFQPQPIFNPTITRRPSPEEIATPQPAPLPGPTSNPPALLAPATPEVFNFRFSAGAKLKAQLERLAEVLGIENPVKNMAEVIEQALEVALEHKDPRRRLARRERRAERRKAAVPAPRPDEGHSCMTQSAEPTPATSRHVPVAIRDRVLARAGYQCEYTSADGVRCSSCTGLQIEHVEPFAIHHRHDEEDLEALCARHNRLRAEQIFGAEHVRRKIEARRVNSAFESG